MIPVKNVAPYIKFKITSKYQSNGPIDLQNGDINYINWNIKSLLYFTITFLKFKDSNV